MWIKGLPKNDTDNNIIDNNLNNTNTNNNAANDNSNKIFDYTDTFSDLRTGEKLIFNTRDGKPAVYVFGGVGSCGLTDYSIESLSTVLRREDYSDVHIYIMDIKRNSSRTILEGAFL